MSYKTSFMWSPRRPPTNNTITPMSTPRLMPSSSKLNRSPRSGNSIQATSRESSPRNRQIRYVTPTTPRLMKPAGLSTETPRHSSIIQGDNPNWMHLPGLKVTKQSPRKQYKLSEEASKTVG